MGIAQLTYSSRYPTFRPVPTTSYTFVHQVIGCLVEVVHAGYVDYGVAPRVDIEDAAAVICVWFNLYQNIAP